LSDDQDVAELLRLGGPRLPVPEERLARLREAARAEWRQALRRRRIRKLAAGSGGLLATAALLVWALEGPSLFRKPAEPPVLGVVAHVTGGAGLVPGARLRAGATLETGAGGRAALRWHDGTNLRLDERTRLRVESAATLWLDAGAVYVDTDGAQASSASLAIATRLGTARHVGTRYEVRMQGPSLRVRVREGSVHLGRAGQVHVATSGDELSVDDDGSVVRRQVPTYGADWLWITAAAPPFQLEGRSAAALLEWAATESGWALHFADPSVAALAAETTLHGTIEGMSPPQALEAVLPTCGLSHRVEDGRLIVRRATR
jgi:hypothetical protein